MPKETVKPVVTITGVTGFIGSQTCLSFLKDGGYTVRGTVRSLDNWQKVGPLRNAFGEYFNQLQLVEADLLNEESIKKAIAGSKYVIHTASPRPLKAPKNETQLIKTAVEGTLNVMRGCQAAKVKRVVITSSVMAIIHNDEDKQNFTTKDWSDIKASGMDAYSKSKILAENAAWQFVKDLSIFNKFELVSINPGFVLGPNLCTAEFTSGEMMKKVMMKKMPGLPYIQIPIVDVRDVANAHVQAIKVSKASGKRFMLVENAYWCTDVGKTLHKNYKKQGYKVARRKIPKFVAKISGVFNKQAKQAVKVWGQEMNFENKQTKDVLKIQFQPMEKTVCDMADTLIQTGYVPDKRKK